MNLQIVSDTPWGLSRPAFQSLRADMPRQLEMFAAAASQPRADSFDDWCQSEADKKAGLQFDAATGIALQRVVGVTYDGCHPWYEMQGWYFNTSRIVEAAAWCEKNSGVRALVLYFRSPGGWVRGVDDACGALLALRAARPDLPVIAYVDGCCCSCAAWIAAGCAERHSARKSSVGSIGTYIVTVDDSQYYAGMGLDVRLHTDGIYKGMGEDGVAWTQEWYEWVEASIAKWSARIKGAVAGACPNITPEWMQGQSFTAADLRDAGETGPGWFLQSVPDLAGNEGFSTFDAFLAAVAASL